MEAADLALEVVDPEVRLQLDAIMRSQSPASMIRALRRLLATERVAVGGDAAASLGLAVESVDAAKEHLRKALGPCPVGYDPTKKVVCIECVWRDDCARDQAGRSVV